MTSSSHTGKSGTPLPENEVVIRLIKSKSMDEKVRADHFAVMGRDDTPPLYSISVCSENLTTPLRAREFMGGNKAAYAKYCRLSVLRIRKLALPELDNKSVLDVVWDKLYIDGTMEVD